jgi:AcrR family transcriptional regulator
MPKKGRKPRQPLSRERALDVAMELADAGGLEAVTMRALAAELGVEAMSLYHHVANKDALLDGMVDRVFAEIALPAMSTDWRAELRRRAQSARAVLRRHPWAIALMESRSTPGPATLRHHDAVLGCLRHAGFSIPLTGHAYAVLDSYVYGFAHTEVNLPMQTSKQTAELASQIMSQFPVDEYPHLAEFTLKQVLQPGYAYGNEFEFGLDLVLDGLDRAFTAERRAP